MGTCAACVDRLGYVCVNEVHEHAVHLLECPLYSDARNMLGTLPSDWADNTIRAFFNKIEGQDWFKLAAFLLRCRRIKTDAMDTMPGR